MESWSLKIVGSLPYPTFPSHGKNAVGGKRRKKEKGGEASRDGMSEGGRRGITPLPQWQRPCKSSSSSFLRLLLRRPAWLGRGEEEEEEEAS